MVQPGAPTDPLRQAATHHITLSNPIETETHSDTARKAQLSPTQANITGVRTPLGFGRDPTPRDHGEVAISYDSLIKTGQ